MALEYDVRSEYKSMSLTQLLESPVMCFEGVGDTQNDILNRYFGVSTVRQLANMPYFLWALGIQELALQGGDPSARSIADMADTKNLKFAVNSFEQGKNALELLSGPVKVLDGLTPSQNLALYDAFRVTNVVQLAHNRIMLEARVIEYLEKHPELLQSTEGPDKSEIASILGADTSVPSSGEEAQDALAGEKADEGMRRMAGELDEHLRGRIDALKVRAAERAKDISSSSGIASGAELTEGIDSVRRATTPTASRTDTLRSIRERTESTRVQSVSTTATTDRLGAINAARAGTTGAGETAAPSGTSRVASATTETSPSMTVRTPSTVQQQPSTEAESADTSEDTGIAAEATVEEEKTSSFFGRWMAAAAVVLVVLVGLAWWLIPTSEPPEQLAGQTEAGQQPTQGTESQVTTTIQPVVAKQPPPEPGPPIRTIHTVIEGQSLWRISRRHYANPLLWPKIFRANDDQIDDPDLIFPDQEFKIPEPQ